jgi:bifunctional DNase/RNase
MLIEMAIKGLMIDQVTSTPIIVLRDKDATRVLEIWVGVFEANAIAVQIENTSSPRPMTHDLLRNVIEDLQGRVERVVISDVRDGTYYAVIHLSVRGDAVAIDARPSDAIALALRAKAPIFAEEHVIEHAKQAEPAASEGETERLQKWLESLDPDDMGKYKM